MSFLSTITDPHSVITPIENGITYPEVLDLTYAKYRHSIEEFKKLINTCEDSGKLLERIRTPRAYSSKTRMSMLKLFRRCVSLVCDTEMSKKVEKVPTSTLVDNYGHTFKPIEILRKQFNALTQDQITALAALLGEYDSRGKQGYSLTGEFFAWFEEAMEGFSIEGPRGAGRDIELNTVFPDFTEKFPCDFIIRHEKTKRVVAVGFARYDSTRGGAQSDDRTGGNSLKVEKARQFCERTGNDFKLLFVSDGPGLAHRDTWEEACYLDGQWNDRTRVSTLSLASERITTEWLMS